MKVAGAWWGGLQPADRLQPVSPARSAGLKAPRRLKACPTTRAATFNGAVDIALDRFPSFAVAQKMRMLISRHLRAESPPAPNRE